MENKNINLELGLKEINIILESLAKSPYGLVAELINKIHNTSKDQLNTISTTNAGKDVHPTDPLQ